MEVGAKIPDALRTSTYVGWRAYVPPKSGTRLYVEVGATIHVRMEVGTKNHQGKNPGYIPTYLSVRSHFLLKQFVHESVAAGLPTQPVFRSAQRAIALPHFLRTYFVDGVICA